MLLKDLLILRATHIFRLGVACVCCTRVLWTLYAELNPFTAKDTKDVKEPGSLAFQSFVRPFAIKLSFIEFRR